jgi:hypothetical protein
MESALRQRASPVSTSSGVSMYCVQLIYRAGRPGSFNLDHYLEVHSPLGIGLLKKHFDVCPVKVLVHMGEPVETPSDMPVAFDCVTSMYFDDKNALEAFVKLFQIESAARALIDDFANYTEMPPEIHISRVIDYPVSDQSPASLQINRGNR